MLVLRFAAAFAVSVGVAAAPAASRDITAGVALTDSDTMQYLEAHGFALNALLSPDWKPGEASEVLNNADLAEIAPLSTLRDVVRTEFRDYQKSYLARSPIIEGIEESQIGTGTYPAHRKFERKYLASRAARYNLVGIINRMDRRFRTPATCGEIRFLYRLAYSVTAAGLVADAEGKPVRKGTVATASRLPMSINLVLRAKKIDGNPGDDDAQCQEIARRWLAAGDSGLKGKELALSLLEPSGALALIEASEIDRMETNIQVMRLPTTISLGFGGNAEYLLNIFDWNEETHTFSRRRLENQIDRDAMLRNPARLAAFKKWLFTPENLYALDEGTITIPDEYLAYSAITSAPGGTSRATNRPFLGLITEDEAREQFAALRAKAAELSPDGKLRNIMSGEGLQQRLTDITCTGCHQSRAIGGFHFMGADRKTYIRELPQNAIFVAGSPHFYGDLPRRREVVEAIAAGREPDYGRGFSMRPADTMRGGKKYFPEEFDSLRNGWGSNCYMLTKGQPAADPSFKSWTCAPQFTCQPIHESRAEPHHGVCVNTIKKEKLKFGDPFVFGEMTFKKSDPPNEMDARVFTYRDAYCAKTDVMNARQAGRGKCLDPIPGQEGSTTTETQDQGYQHGGFFGGMKRRRGCAGDNDPDTTCGTEGGATRVRGKKFNNGAFNQCVAKLGDQKTSFVSCLTSKAFTHDSTLRTCSVLQPCRDDYVCVSTWTTLRDGTGACLPPYFLFQFRTDGHPAPPEGPAAPPECLLPPDELGGPLPPYCRNALMAER
jgi:hypothetical protein